MPDWTSDTKSAWAEYRQLLRDLPSSQHDPYTITWPVPPGAPSVPTHTANT